MLLLLLLWLLLLRRWRLVALDRACGDLLEGCGSRRRNGLRGLLDDGGEDGGVDQTHEEEGLEYRVGELGRLLEEFGGLVRVAHDEAFHLGEDVEELGWGEGR